MKTIEEFTKEFETDIVNCFNKLWPEYENKGYTKIQLYKLIFDEIVSLMSECDEKYKWTYSIIEDDMKVEISKKKPEFVQILNPKTKRYIKINKTIGDIVSHKKSKGPYKNIPIREKK